MSTSQPSTCWTHTIKFKFYCEEVTDYPKLTSVASYIVKVDEASSQGLSGAGSEICEYEYSIEHILDTGLNDVTSTYSSVLILT